ncbi:MAG: glycosyl transferase [Rhodospirillaceae bacterium]|nr:glycosyl transferase [Rhodospirillaceae bacterium]
MTQTEPINTTSSTFEKVTPLVLQVLPSLVTGGVERGTVDVARALVQAGGKAFVASSGGIMTAELTRAGATHTKLPMDLKNPVSIFKNVRRLEMLIEQSGANIIHARSRAPAWSALYAARRTGVPFVTTFHGNYSSENFIKHAYNSVMARGDKVIAISEFIADQLSSRYGVEPEKIVTVPRGVDVANFDPQAVSGSRLIQLADQWRVPEDHRVILLPGRLTRWKGQTVLIEALSRLSNRAGIRCILVGSSQGRKHYVRELKNDIVRCGLQDMVHLAGECRDMPAAMLMADIVISASIEAEAFGRVIVEAQAMGRPVIASDHGAARETVAHGKTGWLVPPSDADALARMLEYVLSIDTSNRERVINSAMANVRKTYTREKMCGHTLQVYKTILDEFETK